MLEDIEYQLVRVHPLDTTYTTLESNVIRIATKKRAETLTDMMRD